VTGRAPHPLIAAPLAGIAAGSIATAVQLGLWWIDSAPVAKLLARDTRLTAAIVMGQGALDERNALTLGMIAVATLIHFSLSIAYALVLAALIRGLRRQAALLAGGIYGLALYAVNLYGFTVLLPWFAVSRGWITALTHLAFGLVLAAVLVGLRRD
jgi:hypothetical protein